MQMNKKALAVVGAIVFTVAVSLVIAAVLRGGKPTLKGTWVVVEQNGLNMRGLDDQGTMTTFTFSDDTHGEVKTVRMMGGMIMEDYADPFTAENGKLVIGNGSPVDYALKGNMLTFVFYNEELLLEKR